MFDLAGPTVYTHRSCPYRLCMQLEKTSWEQMSPSSMLFCVPGANPTSEQVFFIDVCLHSRPLITYEKASESQIVLLYLFVCVCVSSVSRVPEDVWQRYREEHQQGDVWGPGEWHVGSG